MLIGWVLVGVAAAWLGFAYAGYPALLLGLARWRPREVAAAAVHPPLSLVIAVHNGGPRLADKLENTLALDYPAPVRVMVASDGSTDETDAVAREYEARGVELVRNPERMGKEAAQAAALARIEAGLVVFTDVGAELEADALRRLAEPFADASIGRQ